MATTVPTARHYLSAMPRKLVARESVVAHAAAALARAVPRASVRTIRDGAVVGPAYGPVIARPTLAAAFDADPAP